jgi:hypothetical protein
MVEVTLPSTAGDSQPIHIFVGEFGTFSEQQSELHDACYLQYPPPEISSCTQLRSPGDLIRIHGQNFGNMKNCSVKFGDQLVAATVTSHHQQITCVVPENPGVHRGAHKQQLQVCIGGRWSTKEFVFEYKGKLFCS